MTRSEKIKATKQRNAEYEAKMAKIYAEARIIVATGKCPECGSKLIRNLAIAGWWMCEQKGTVGFRARDNDPSCYFQTFTE